MTRVHTFLLFSSLEGHLQWQIRSPNPALVHSWTESLEAVAKKIKQSYASIYSPRGVVM